jgi:hypothetical protein
VSLNEPAKRSSRCLQIHQKVFGNKLWGIDRMTLFNKPVFEGRRRGHRTM